VIRFGLRAGRPRRLLLVAAATLLPVLAGCEAGNNAPTVSFHQPTDATGTTVSDDQLAIRNVFVLGTPLGGSLQPGESAGLYFAVINSGRADRLVSITAPGTSPSVTLPGGGINVRSLHPVFLQGPVTQAYLTDLSRTVTNGSSIKIVMHFLRAGPVTLQVPVFARTQNFFAFGQPPTPTPSPTATATAGHRHHRRPSPTPTPSATS